MIKAISYWSVQNSGTCTVQDAINQAKNANFQAIELLRGTDAPLTPETSKTPASNTAKRGDKAGILLESVASGMSGDATQPTSTPQSAENQSKSTTALQKSRMARIKSSFRTRRSPDPREPDFKPASTTTRSLEWARGGGHRTRQARKTSGSKSQLKRLNGFLYSPRDLPTLSTASAIHRSEPISMSENVFEPPAVRRNGSKSSEAGLTGSTSRTSSFQSARSLILRPPRGDVPWKRNNRRHQENRL